MKTTFKNILLLTLLSVVIAGCEKNVYIKIPNNDPKLVVNSYLCTQNDSIFVYVTQTSPLYTRSISKVNISNATVTISDENGTKIPFVLHNYDTVKSTPCVFVAENKGFLFSGKTYRLDVSCKGFAPVYAETTIPRFHENLDLTYKEPILRDKDDHEKWWDVHLEFNDPIETTDFYAIVRKKGYTYSSDISILNSMGNKWIFSDVHLEGTLIKNTIAVRSWYYDPDTEGPIKDTVTVSFMQTDYSFYQYHKVFNQSGILPEDGLEGFSEPIILFNNINGGVGCFASYHEHRIKIAIPK